MFHEVKCKPTTTSVRLLTVLHRELEEYVDKLGGYATHRHLKNINEDRKHWESGE
jgi:hypothetical protein